jgi:Resolvase, N terminal domain
MRRRPARPRLRPFWRGRALRNSPPPAFAYLVWPARAAAGKQPPGLSGGKFVCYYRISTGRQGKSGLGLDAQRLAVTAYLNGGNWKIVDEFTEIESGKNSDRPALDKGPGGSQASFRRSTS